MGTLKGSRISNEIFTVEPFDELTLILYPPSRIQVNFSSLEKACRMIIERQSFSCSDPQGDPELDIRRNKPTSRLGHRDSACFQYRHSFA